MKKILVFAVLVVTMILSGCVGQKTVETSSPVERTVLAEIKNEQTKAELEEINAIAVKGTLWAIDEENMKYLTDAVNRNDIEYLNQLMLEGKVFKVDKDTKVVSFGVAADENNALIKFKEGRYTNKAGCTFKTNVVIEKNFPAYLEEQNKETSKLIQKYLSESENYYELISSGKVEEIKQIMELYNVEDKKMIEKKKDVHINLAMKETIDKARDVILCRYMVFSSYLDYVDFSKKIEKENQSSKEISYYKYRQEQAQKTLIEYRQKAEELRQEFRDKYGF